MEYGEDNVANKHSLFVQTYLWDYYAMHYFKFLLLLIYRTLSKNDIQVSVRFLYPTILF